MLAQTLGQVPAQLAQRPHGRSAPVSELVGERFLQPLEALDEGGLELGRNSHLLGLQLAEAAFERLLPARLIFAQPPVHLSYERLATMGARLRQASLFVQAGLDPRERVRRLCALASRSRHQGDDSHQRAEHQCAEQYEGGCRLHWRLHEGQSDTSGSRRGRTRPGPRSSHLAVLRQPFTVNPRPG